MFLYLAFFASYAQADPFKIRKFVYDLAWTGISAGGYRICQ
jgi:hypothetical protein